MPYNAVHAVLVPSACDELRLRKAISQELVRCGFACKPDELVVADPSDGVEGGDFLIAAMEEGLVRHGFEVPENGELVADEDDNEIENEEDL